MSVSETINLPAQPTTGYTEIRDLGGNGITSPRFMMDLYAEIGGDASAGTAQIRAVFDPTYAAMLAFVSATQQGIVAAGAQPTRYNLKTGPTSDPGIEATIIPPTMSTVSAATAWIPPPVILRRQDSPQDSAYPQLRVFVDNDAALTLKVTAQIYIFDLSSIDLVPIDIIQRVMGSSGAVY